DLAGLNLRQADHDGLVLPPDHGKAPGQTFALRVRFREAKVGWAQAREFAPGLERRRPRRGPLLAQGFDRRAGEGQGNRHGHAIATSTMEWVSPPVRASVVSFAATLVSSPRSPISSACPFQTTRGPSSFRAGGRLD